MATEHQTGAESLDQISAPVSVPPQQVLYCTVCSFPPEYCEFGYHINKCKEWLQAEHPALYEKYYSEEAIKSKREALSSDAQKKLEHDLEQKAKKAEAKESAEEQKKKTSIITIKKIRVTKNKMSTTIHGLEAFGVDLKKLAKEFGKRFATGSSVRKNPQGQEEIAIQGDVADTIVEYIEEKVKAIPKENIIIEEEKKKKGE